MESVFLLNKVFIGLLQTGSKVGSGVILMDISIRQPSLPFLHRLLLNFSFDSNFASHIEKKFPGALNQSYEWNENSLKFESLKANVRILNLVTWVYPTLKKKIALEDSNPVANLFKNAKQSKNFVH